LNKFNYLEADFQDYYNECMVNVTIFKKWYYDQQLNSYLQNSVYWNSRLL